MAHKMAKPTLKKAHRIARSVERSSGSSTVNPYAVGTATAKRAAAKRRRARGK